MCVCVCVCVCGSGMGLRWSRHGTEILKECLLLASQSWSVSQRAVPKQDRAAKTAFSSSFFLFCFCLYSIVSVILDIFNKNKVPFKCFSIVMKIKVFQIEGNTESLKMLKLFHDCHINVHTVIVFDNQLMLTVDSSCIENFPWIESDDSCCSNHRGLTQLQDFTLIFSQINGITHNTQHHIFRDYNFFLLTSPPFWSRLILTFPSGWILMTVDGSAQNFVQTFLVP